MSNHDTLDLLTRARPTADALDDAWPAEERETVWRRAVAQAAAPARPTRPRRRTAWLSAAAAVSALAVVPVVVDGGDAAARAEILRLAVVAAGADGPAIAPGTVLHVRGTSLQENSSVLGDGASLDDEYESWVRWDGATWVETTRPSAGWTERAFYPAPRRADFGTPTPAFVDALPDDPDALRAYLDDTVSGSNSHEEAVFVAITDLAHSHLLDPATLAVALEVLADVDGVRTRDVVVAGRDAVEISRDRFVIGLLGRKTITVDRATGQVLRTASSDPGGTSESTTTLLETVDAVPERVRAALRRHGNGSRVCADGSEPFDDEPCP